MIHPRIAARQILGMLTVPRCHWSALRAPIRTCLLLALACRGVGADGKTAQTGRSPASLSSLFLEAPCWLTLEEGDPESQDRMREIEKVLTITDECDTETIHEAIRNFSKKLSDADPYDIERTSPLRNAIIFLVNRWIFDCGVVDEIPKEITGAYMGVRELDRKWDLSWPVGKGVDGSLRIVGYPKGFPPKFYDGLDEFEYFRKHFGRRKKPKTSHEGHIF